MTEFEDKYANIDDLFDFDPDLSESKFINQRTATRYIRNDIQAVFYKINFFTRFGFKFFRRLIQAELLDLSSKGALISTGIKLKKSTQIVIGFKFKSRKTFRIKALIVRLSATQTGYEYGIKFDDLNNALGDYLVETQSELRFK